MRRQSLSHGFRRGCRTRRGGRQSARLASRMRSHGLGIDLVLDGEDRAPRASPACRRRAPARPAAATIGPASSSGVTKCTVAPLTFTPWSSAWRWASMPGNAGSSDGWMLSTADRKRVAERRAEQAHEAGQADESNAAFAQRRDERAVVGVARRVVAVRHDERLDARAARDREPAGVGAIRDHDARSRARSRPSRRSPSTSACRLIPAPRSARQEGDGARFPQIRLSRGQVSESLAGAGIGLAIGGGS